VNCDADRVYNDQREATVFFPNANAVGRGQSTFRPYCPTADVFVCYIAVATDRIQNTVIRETQYSWKDPYNEAAGVVLNRRGCQGQRPEFEKNMQSFVSSAFWVRNCAAADH